MIPGWTELVEALSALPDWQAAAVVAVGTVLAAGLVRVGGDLLVRRVTTRIPGAVDDVVLGTLHPPLYVTVALAGALLLRGPLGLDAALSARVAAVVLSALVALWAWTLVRAGRRVSRTLTAEDRVDAAVVPIFQNVWSALVLGVAGFALLAFWEVDVTPLLASAGIVGIVVGLAARDTIANFFGSIALYVDGTYAVGDYIVLESGERGRVEDISIRSTVLRTRDDVLVTVPNSVLNSARIVNESTPDRERRIRVPLGVAYDSDLDRVEETLLAVAADSDLVLERPTPRVRFRRFGESAVELELLAWVADPVLRGRGTHLLVKDVHRRFREADIAIPFPQRDVRVVSGEGAPLSAPVDGGARADGGDGPTAGPDGDTAGPPGGGPTASPSGRPTGSPDSDA